MWSQNYNFRPWSRGRNCSFLCCRSTAYRCNDGCSVEWNRRQPRGVRASVARRLSPWWVLPSARSRRRWPDSSLPWPSTQGVILGLVFAFIFCRKYNRYWRRRVNPVRSWIIVQIDKNYQWFNLTVIKNLDLTELNGTFILCQSP
jgi:hypothetical protein